jgi:hypothetical protein
METEAAIREGSLQVTALLLIAAGVLLALGFAGVGGSYFLVASLVALGLVLYAVRPESHALGRVGGVNLDHLLDSLWVAFVVAALPLMFEPSATPAEVQALGGLLGLAGMANYFVRPLYLLAYSLVSSLFGPGEGRANGR